MGRLDGKVALISGAAGGQGKAAALLFAREGARIAGCDLNLEGLEETLRLVLAAGGEMIATGPVDLSSFDEAKAWINHAAARFGAIDILYNSAGLTSNNTLDVVAFPIRAAWRHMVKRGGGSIINTGTILARRVVAPPLIRDAIGTGGVPALAPHLAVEGGPHGIRVNTLTPGLIETEATTGFIKDPTNPSHSQIRTSPLGRVGGPEDVASVALFLASDDSRYVTGREIIVDGGQTVGVGMSFGLDPDAAARHDDNRELKDNVALLRRPAVTPRSPAAGWGASVTA